MTKTRRTTAEDVVLEWLSQDEWREVLAIKLPAKDRQLLENLRDNGNQPINVASAGYSGRASAVSRLNQKLRLCGKTGFFLKAVDGMSWPETSLRLYVRKNR